MSAARSLAPRPTTTLVTPVTLTPVKPVKPNPAKSVGRPERSTPRLRAAQDRREQALAAVDSAGMLHAEALGYRLLSSADERALGARIQAGGPDAEAARERLILANIRLVESYAAKAVRKRTSPVPYEDLVGAGMFGLLTAVDRYDPARGTRFSTLALWWIRQAVERYRDDHELAVRLPAYLRHRERMARRLALSYEQEHGALPSDEWLADALNHIKYLRGGLRPLGSGMATLGHTGGRSSPAQVREARAHVIGAMSLDQTVYTREGIGAEADVSRYDAFADPQGAAALAAVEDRESEARLVQLLLELHSAGQLSARELKLLGMRLGPARATLQQVGHALGVTRQRVLQLQQHALDTLRRALALRGIRSTADWLGETSGRKGRG